MKFKFFIGALVASGVILSLASCGSGGGGSAASTAPSPTAAVSTGAITAFGSVFVNGHEFNSTNASVVDDDTGAKTAGTGNLEVGMVVSVDSATGSTSATPVAADIHVDPLARGFIDAIGSDTVTVMGQTVQISTATAFSDHRTCVTATPTPCTAISGQSGLVATTGTTPGTFVTVHGYLFSTGTPAQTQIVATLISASDFTQGSSQFKLEGQVTGLTGSILTIGSESVDLSNAVCKANDAVVACASAFTAGNTVAARGLTAPAAGAFAPDVARLARLLPQTAGATVEVEGKVSSVSGTSFVVRGIAIDGSGLPANQIPAVGDKVELLGTVSSNGTSVTATSMEQDVPAAASRVILAGPLSNVTPGTATGTFNVTVLGQTAIIDATTNIADRTVFPPPTFNITNFDTYLQGKTVFVVLRTRVDTSGNLHATGFDIVKMSHNNLVAVAGPADAAPTAGTPDNTVTIHGVSVIYDPAKATTVAQGSILAARGALTSSGAVDTTVSGGHLFVLPNTTADHDHGFDGF